MKTGFWNKLIPPEAAYITAWCHAAIARVRDRPSDAGEVGIIGAVIMVVGFAVAAAVLVAAVKGKLQSWVSQIP
jgi:hypothetical protein